MLTTITTAQAAMISDGTTTSPVSAASTAVIGSW